MIEKIVNDLNQEFDIAPNSVEAQKVLEETQKQVEALQIDEKYKKALLTNAETIKLEQSKISLAVAEKLFSDNIKLEELKRKAQMQKENYEKSLEKQAYNAIEQTTPSSDANKLVDENFENKVVSSQIIRELKKNEEQIAKNNKDMLEDIKKAEEGFITKLTNNLFGKKAVEQEAQDNDSFELSDEKELKQASKNLSNDKSLDDLKEDIKSQTIEEPAKIESKEESVSFNQVLSFIRDKNTIESPFADGTFSDKVNQTALYNNFSKMNIKELRELLNDIKAKNTMLEQQLENLKSGVVSEISKELKANEELKTEKKELKELTSQNNINTEELIDDVKKIIEPKAKVEATQSNDNTTDDITNETRSILNSLANEYNVEVEPEKKMSEEEKINRDEEMEKLRAGLDLDAVVMSSSEEQSSNNNGKHYSDKYLKTMK